MSARLAAALAQHVARTTTAVLPVAAAVFAGTVFFWGVADVFWVQSDVSNRICMFCRGAIVF